MSTIVTDVQNVVQEGGTPPDRLRGEIGKYYFSGPGAPFVPTSFSQSKINKTYFEHITQNVQSSINPKKRSRIYISSKEDQFRDHNQWRNYISSIVSLQTNFVDHTLAISDFEVETEFVKNFHHPSYEDATKIYGSNQLLNINLITHTNKTDVVDRMSLIKTEFDNPVQDPSLESVLSQFGNRISNYTGSVVEISRKQRNIFDIFTNAPSDDQKSKFPYYISKEVTLGGFDSELNQILNSSYLLKNIFQTIKEDIYYSFVDFSVQGSPATLKVTNLTNSILSPKITAFSEKFDETFLLSEEEQRDVGLTGRFVNNIRATAFLSNYRDLISDEMRNIEEIFNCNTVKKYLIGYKIEKYLDSDTSGPIQTYYINDTSFFDTQLKYGREYVYKTKALIAVLGTSHRYTNLVVSQNDIDMVNTDSSVVENIPAGFSEIVGEKYKAYFDVEVTPSFQIVEYEIENRSHAFVDTPLLYPHVDFYHNSKMPVVNFMISPSNFMIDQGSLAGPTSNESLVRELNPLLESDLRIRELLDMSENQIDFKYFNGEYEIYRMDSPPSTREDFADNFLTSVDTETRHFHNNQNTPESSFYFFERDYRAYFTDYLIPNKKYYYVFRALTYHGTPSNITVPYEVELLKDSDEYKVIVKQYRYPLAKDRDRSHNFRRLLRIVPNSERLEPEINELGLLDHIGHGDHRLVSQGDGETFKIRIKSKHTGKTIDLNVSFRAVIRQPNN